ncbi:Diguanylate cyclase [Sphingomonas sp. EC-HK361]|uniref:putative bifunctional diguanylate cyclase/phosphodiesterase n=1 Tax=Sphingomonas sp. EC-HK361 TaxID=2038397 RepID=UPI00125170DE|nr:EAL domain-containing protein [Sphingomonas sp. EC-HK361]VVT24572.1 Diguanylate cyclase [Sphingomonas sp. EC-HK361]
MRRTGPATSGDFAARIARLQPHALPAVVLLLVSLLFVRLATSDENLGAATLLLVGVAAACLGHSVLREAAIGRAVRRLRRLAALDQADGRSLDSLVGSVERHFAANEERLGQRHRLTGLPTREPLLARIAADGDGTLGILFFPDVERLSAFDTALADRLCTILADRTARMVSRRMVAHVDRSQIAIWYGPDSDASNAVTELEAVRYALGSAITEDGREILPEIRCGHARMADTASPDALLARARAAATLGPAAPEGARVSADPIAEVRDRFAIEQDLRQAIARHELSLHYQPLIDSADARVCGAEALLRWTHTSRGMVPPSTFIPIMEDAGLSEEIGLWVLNSACREARRWQTASLGALRVAVNASAHQLARPDVRALVERSFRRHRLPASALELELTESAATQDTEHTRALFDSLRALGVTIAIDDFGTGFSSLTALRTLAFDKIKIDRQFVTEVDRRRDSQAICQSIIALGRGLGARVLAEGVERREEYLWLRQHGCTHFQGFHFARPMPPADFEAFVRAPDTLAALLAVDPTAIQTSISKRLTA